MCFVQLVIKKLTKISSDHKHFLIFRKKQIRVARMNAPISGTENPIHTAQIQSIRNFSGKIAYNSFSGPKI